MTEENDVYVSLAKKVGYPNSKAMRKVLRSLVTPVEAELVNNLPTTSQALAKRLKLDEGHVNKILQKLYKKGVVTHNPQGYVFITSMEQLMLGTLNGTKEKPIKKLDNAWGEMHHELSRNLAKEILPTPLFYRIVPYWKSIVNVTGVLPIDDMREIIKAQNTMVVIECVCRRMLKNCDNPRSVCIQFGDRAENLIARNMGKKVFVDEAMSIIDKVMEAGLIHTIYNTRMIEQINWVCNCCPCCCAFNLADTYAGRKPWESCMPSRFVATVDETLCDGCGVCIKRCHFKAIKEVRVPGIKKIKTSIDTSKCTGCGACVTSCKTNAMKLSVVRPPEFIPISGKAHPIMLGWVD